MYYLVEMELGKRKHLYSMYVVFIVVIQTVNFKEGPVNSITEMAVSYNCEYLAMFTDTGLLWIGSADLEVLYFYLFVTE